MILFITHAEGMVISGICLSVCFSARYLKNRCSTKLDREVFHQESWRSIYLGVKMSKVKVTRHKNSTGVEFSTLVSAGFF